MGEPAKRALDQAAALAKALGAEVSVLSVMRVEHGRPVMPWDDRDLHTDEIVKAQALLAKRGITAEPLERSGEPAEAIKQVADGGGFDAVVVGSRGLGTVERGHAGGVSSHVAAHAHATIVVVR